MCEPQAPPQVWAVTATYNERGNLPELSKGILQLDVPVTLLIVDDNSPDGTGELADQLAQEHPGRFEVLHRPGKMGYGSAHRLGIQHALDGGAEIVVTMDADLSHDPSVIPDLLEPLADHDVAVGSRYVEGGGTANWGLERKVLSRGAGMLVRLASGLRQRDPTSGFRAYRAPILEAATFQEATQEGYAFLVEMLFRCHRAGARIAEVPITFADRRAGKSKLSKKIILESAWRLLPLSWRRVTRWKP
jgi:dolichol-phosphate mannosyltransferase